MLNSAKHFYEGLRLSSTETRDKILERWGVEYGAVDELKASLENEFGVEVLQGQAAPRVEQPVHAAQLAGNALDLQGRRDQQALLEQTAQDRHLIESRRDVERALDEFAA